MSLANFGVYSSYYLNKNNIDAFNRTITTLQRDCKLIRARQSKNKKNSDKNEKLRTSKNLYRIEKKELLINSESSLFGGEETTSSSQMAAEYLISKQKEMQDVHSVKTIDGNKMIMTRNEQRKLNQNSVAEKLEIMHQRDIDHQLTSNLTTIKREKSLILDKYLELEAIKFYYSRNNFNGLSKSNKTRIVKSAPVEESQRKIRSSKPVIDFIVPPSIEALGQEQVNLNTKLTEFYGKSDNSLPSRQQMSAPAYFRSYVDCIRSNFFKLDSNFKFESQIFWSQNSNLKSLNLIQT
jgi:hypothetical protein